MGKITRSLSWILNVCLIVSIFWLIADWFVKWAAVPQLRNEKIIAEKFSSAVNAPKSFFDNVVEKKTKIPRENKAWNMAVRYE